MNLSCPRCGRAISQSHAPGETVTCSNCGARLSVVSTELAREAAQGMEGVMPSMTASPPGPSGTPRAAPDEPTPPDPAASAGRLPAGFKIGGYEVGRTLGQGGMATIYEARQESLGRMVAIKVLSRRLSRNPVFVARFEHEAGLLASLTHPNIVNIIDRGSSNGLYYMVMELVEGVTLNQLLHAVDLKERHFVHIIEELARALSHIHSMGVIHRDIKPSNILVTKHGVVKLTDFGIAQPAAGAGRDSASMGTAIYMAPEVVESPDSVDSRADIFSLAVTFYRMFTRQLPAKPRAPVSSLNQKLPRGIDAVLDKAMSWRAGLRYATAREFCDELLTCFSVTPAQVREHEHGPSPLEFNPSLFSPDMTTTSMKRALEGKDLTTSKVFLVPNIPPPPEVHDATGARKWLWFTLSAMAAAAGIAAAIWSIAAS